MSINLLELRNFKRFERFDISLNKSVTAILGENSSGKSSILKAILALKQTISVTNEHESWAANGEYVDLGTYRDYVYRKDIKKAFSVALTLDLGSLRAPGLMFRAIQGATSFRCAFEYDYDAITAQARFKSVVAKFPHADADLWWKIQRQKTRTSYALTFSADLIASIKKEFSFSDKDGRIKAGDKIIVEHTERFAFEMNSNSNKEDFLNYFAFRLVNDNLSSLSEYLEKKLFYLAPLRSSPARSYVRSSHSLAVGVGGEHTPSVLANLEGRAKKATRGHSEIRDRLEWLQSAIAQIFPGYSVSTKTYDELVKLTVSNADTVKYASRDKSDAISDVGFGFSQVLPILVQIAVMPEGSTLLVEQPELHLHPMAQTRLGQVIAGAVTQGKRIIVETHSEHFVRGLQLAVSSRKKNSTSGLNSDAVGFFYVKRTSSKCEMLELNNFGEFVQEWPSGFFDESYRSLKALIANKARSV